MTILNNLILNMLKSKYKNDIKCLVYGDDDCKMICIELSYIISKNDKIYALSHLTIPYAEFIKHMTNYVGSLEFKEKIKDSEESLVEQIEKDTR